MTLCVRDEDGNLIKQNFYPLTLHYKTQFDIILATEYVNNKFQYSIEEMNEQRAFNEALEYLEDDDELAFKLGPSTFLYQGKDNIKKLMLIASGRGIVPIITLLRRVLSSQQEFQIENCMLIWINEDKDDDFILDEEIEELEDEFPDQLIVRRVHDSKLTEQGRVLDRRMLDGLPMYESGRVAIVSVDEVTPIEAKFQDAFDELGYPQENVMFV